MIRDTSTWIRPYEEVDRDRLDIIRGLIRTAFRGAQAVDDFCGVYVLFKKNKPIYVGQAKSIAKRIAQHVGVKDFDTYGVIPCDRMELNEIERLAITILQPPLNLVGGERVRGVLVPMKPMRLERRA